VRRRLRRPERRALGAAAVAVALFGAVSHPHIGAGPARTAAPVSVSGNVALGQRLAGSYGWSAGPQWTCLYDLWERESGWQTLATYPSTTTPPSAPANSITTAYGIPQALPAQQMAAAGADWQTNPATQIRWGLGYIRGRYGDPCGAWSHETADSWY